MTNTERIKSLMAKLIKISECVLKMEDESEKDKSRVKELEAETRRYQDWARKAESQVLAQALEIKVLRDAISQERLCFFRKGEEHLWDRTMAIREQLQKEILADVPTSSNSVALAEAFEALEKAVERCRDEEDYDFINVINALAAIKQAREGRP